MGLSNILISNSDNQNKYNNLLDDPNGIIALPKGFKYQIISQEKQLMDDGLLVPPNADGMMCFKGTGDNVILVRNHEIGHVPELSTFFKNNPYGDNFKEYIKNNSSKFYDIKNNNTHCFGGTTSIVYNTKTKKTKTQYLSLIGTLVNCSGGSTPWNTWISCEETVFKNGIGINKKHGYNFEVIPSEKVKLSNAKPIEAMGRFRHEGIAFNQSGSCVYQTEDREDGLLYKFIPNDKNSLDKGGKLQFLSLKDFRGVDTSNWENNIIKIGKKYPVRWIDIDDVESSNDDLRYRGKNKGGATFARGEGVWSHKNDVFFTATTGGPKKKGQIWKYTKYGNNSEDYLELIFESTSKEIINMPDNIIIAPWGDIIICEDGKGRDSLIGIKPNGQIYNLATNLLNNQEFAGVCFDPKGEILFVNIYNPTLTLAITGPWESLSAKF